MKKIKMSAASLAARLCGVGLAILGLTSCNDQPCMYGDPFTPFDANITGDVTAEADGKPVEGARVVVKNYKDWSVASATTDAEGEYSIDTRNQTDKPKKGSSYVACYPPEGSGLEADSVTIHSDDVKKSHGSDIYVDEINFKLKPKK